MHRETGLPGSSRESRERGETRLQTGPLPLGLRASRVTPSAQPFQQLNSTIHDLFINKRTQTYGKLNGEAWACMATLEPGHHATHAWGL